LSAKTLSWIYSIYVLGISSENRASGPFVNIDMRLNLGGGNGTGSGKQTHCFYHQSRYIHFLFYEVTSDGVEYSTFEYEYRKNSNTNTFNL